jgi:hypothetical protein
MALIGLLSLSGMLIRNGIVLVEEIEQQKQEKDQRQAIIDAATSSAAYTADGLYHRAWPGPAAARCLFPEYGGGDHVRARLCHHSDATGSAGYLRLFSP